MNNDPYSVIYCFRWNFRRRRPGVPLTRDDALEKYISGEEFTAALLSNPDAQPVLVTCAWKNQYASTMFLDNFGRSKAKYTFEKIDSKKLFLNAIYLWEYGDEDPTLTPVEAVKFEEIYFFEDGSARNIKVDKEANIKDTIDYNNVPVQGNWEAFPEFGEWSSISRFER